MYKQAGAELGQAQLKLELGFTPTRIWGTALIIANCYQLLHMTEHGEELPILSSTPFSTHTTLAYSKLPQIILLTI